MTFKVCFATSLILTYTSIFLFSVMEIFLVSILSVFAVFSESVDILLLDTLVGLERTMVCARIRECRETERTVVCARVRECRGPQANVPSRLKEST